jgi:ABC-2 type transport system ATP-binding protein
MAPMIVAQGLHREFRTVKRQSGFLGSIRTLFTRQYNVVRAVDHVTFSIEREELIGYIGPNGAGKSTTIKMLTGVLVPTSGYVETGGLVPHKHRQELAGRIGAVFGQRSQLWWDLPLGESFRILKEVYRVSGETYERNMRTFNELVGLDELLDTPVRQLSLGQRMRGEMTAALLHDPGIVFLDEPLLGLDVVAKERMRQFIAEINAKRGVTVILASNDMADVERLCQRIIIIDRGRLLYDGTVEEIKRRHAPYRTLVVHFGEDYAEIRADGAELVRRDTRRAWLRFGRAVNPQRLIADLSQRYLITDLSIEEPTLEEVIRRIYESEGRRAAEREGGGP